jgi:hypothetical protein
MEDKKKIILTQSQIKICKLFAAEGLEDERAKAEAEGIPFDYEAEKAKREHEFIMFYAAEMAKKRDWEETRDKAFQSVIGELVGSTKLDNYIRDHVPNLKALRDMDPADVLKADGYGKKTVEDLRKLQEGLTKHRNILPRLNKAIEADRHLRNFVHEHSSMLSVYRTLQRTARNTESYLSQTWKYYGR